MAITPIALGVHSSSANPVGSFASGMEFRQQVDANKLAAMRAGVELLASAGLSALNGDLNGEVNPQAWNTALDDLEGMNIPGLNLENYRDSEMARSVAFRGMTTAQAIQAAQNDEQLELAREQFEYEIANDAAEVASPQSPLGKLRADFDNGLIDEDEYRRALTAEFGEWTDLVDPADRAAAGIPDEDKRPAQRGPDGELRFPGGSGTNVSVDARTTGPIPAGYRNVYDEDGNLVRQEPIPGSPAWREAQEEDESAANADAIAERYATIVIDDIGRSIASIESNPGMTTGVVGSFTEGWPGFPAHNAQQLLTGVQANIGFDRLQAMRDASPTGGALGQVSERELGFLQAVYGSLEQSQDAGQLLYNLKRLFNLYNDVVHGVGNGPQRHSLGNADGGTTSTDVPWRVVE